MRKKKFNSLLALVLVFSMAFSQPAAVFAEENTTVADDGSDGAVITEDETSAGEESLPETGNEDSGDVQNPAGGGDFQTETGDQDDSQTPDGEDGTLSGSENGEDGSLSGNENGEDSSQSGSENGEDGSLSDGENGEDVQNPDEGDGSEEENGEDSQTPEDEASEDNQTEEDTTPAEDEDVDETLKREAQINGVSVENQKKLNELGFQTMTLTQSMKIEKTTLAQVVSTMSNMEPDVDYIEGELVYLADSEEEARKVAECYGGTLSGYDYGIAVADIEQTVKDAVKIAADTSISIPAVYPNIIYTIAEEWDTSTVDTSDITISEVSQDEADASDDDQISAQSQAELDSQWHHATIHTQDAWGTSEASKGKGVTVAVLDTGVDYEHPDLKDNIVKHMSTVDADNNGTIDDPEGGMDEHGHGTHCAGLIAAVENGTGVVGVAPMASIYSIQTMDSNGSGTTKSIVGGLEAALKANVDVISMSLGSSYFDALEQKAINKVLKKGIVVVAAAGNGSSTHYDIETVNGVPYKEYPAGYTNVIAVAACSDADSYGNNYLTYFSNYGSWVDVAAPGDNIYSTLPRSKDSYGNKSGTSMACPIVAGTVALMLANNEKLKNTNTIACVNRIRSDLKATANANGARSYYRWKEENEYYNGGFDNISYYPLINAAEAVYAQLDGLEAPTITFASPAADGKNNVTVGADTTFTLAAASEHDKIYYTVNGKKPTPATGTPYYGPVSVTGYSSGKNKIQAIAVRGSKTSKVLSKAFTLKFAVSGVYPSGVAYTTENDVPKANMNVVAGKSIQLAVSISPSNATNKKITWTCSDTSKGIKVNKNGKVTCSKSTAAGTSVVITAESNDESKKKCEFTITAVTDAVNSLTLDKESLTMSWHAPYSDEGVSFGDETKYQYYHDLVVTSAGTGSAATNTQYLYKSSNTNVATVNANGRIYARAKGKAKITVTANDGSGKKAVCNVTVVTPIIDIAYLSSTGYSGSTSTYNNYYKPYNEYPVIPIAAGATIKMKTWVNYSDLKLSATSKRIYAPSNKSLEWTSSDETKLTVKNGKVTCKKDATPDSTINVTISAKKGYGYGESVTVSFLVIDKAEKIYLSNGSKEIPAISCSGREGSIWGDPLQSIDVSVGGTTHKNMKLKVKTATKEYDLYEYMTKYENYDLVSINVSNKDVVQNIYHWASLADIIKGISNGYYWLGTKPGSCKVSYVLNDGSKKKFTVSYKVKK